jgi:N-acetylgalactosamine-6-sulfatase
MISRRTFLATPAAAALAQPKQPNIILFLADDLGYGDLSSYGAPDIRTPHIDSIGSRGMRFTQFYSNAPECTPARAALLTGRYQQRVGGLECAIGVGNVGRYDEAVWLAERGELGLPTSETSLARMLKTAGYDTGLFGKWHLGYNPQFSPNAHGFDEAFYIKGGNADYFKHTEEGGAHVLARNGKSIEVPGYLTDLFAREAVQWIGQRKRPFFAYVAFNAPHTPIQDPEDPSNKRRDRSIYAKMVERMDTAVGSILKVAPPNTIALFLSDNGGDPNGRNLPYRGRKSSMWEGGIRVPCMITWPGVVKPGSESNQVALDMDLTATLVKAGGAKAPKPLDGIDLAPVLSGARKPFPRTVFWRYKRAENRRKAAREGDMKLVIDNQQEALHDIAADPVEERDLLKEKPEVAARLKKLLAQWEEEVRAARLAGFQKAQARP